MVRLVLLAVLVGLLASIGRGTGSFGADTARVAALAGNDQFTTVAGANAHVWTGTSADLDMLGTPIPALVSAVFEWSNSAQSFRFWFRGFPDSFNTLTTLTTHGYYFFQSPGGVLFVIPNSAGYVPPSPTPSFATNATGGSTGTLWAGGPLAPNDLPGGVSAVFHWSNEAQSFQFWFRGFPVSFNTLPPMLAAGEFYFLQASMGQVVNVPAPAAPGTSAAVIDLALANGTLQVLPNTTVPETALTYKLFADFGDPRLPAQFQIVGTGGGESGFLSKAGRDFNTFSPAAQALVKPFLLPPGAAGSWYDQRFSARGPSAPGPQSRAAPAITWDTVANSRIKVWWHQDRPQDASLAQTLLTEVDTVIWPTLTTLMGGAAHEPPPDAGCGEFSGGDGKFDIYIVDPLALPSFAAYQGACYSAGTAPFPTWTIIEADTNANRFKSTMAHEFMHAVQYTFTDLNTDGLSWLGESTATWAEDFVYPTSQSEHGFVGTFAQGLNNGGSLTTYVHTTGPQYGAYLWWYYLTKSLNNNNLIRQIWAMPHNDDILTEIATLLGGTSVLQQKWRDFASNLAGVGSANQFEVWDGLTNLPGTSIVDEVPWTRPFVIDTAPLGANVWRLDATAIPLQSKLRIGNPSFADPAVIVQLYIKRSTGWQGPIALTSEFQRFCGLITTGGIQELVIVATNGELTGPHRGGDMKPAFTGEPCTIHVDVTVSQDYEVSPDPPAHPVKRHWTITSSFDMELRTGPDTGVYIYDSLPGGTIQWTLTDQHCTGQASGSFTIGSQTTSTVGYARFRDEKATNTYFTPAVFNPFNLENLTHTCPWGNENTDPPEFWFAGPNGKLSFDWEDGFLGAYTFHSFIGDTTIDQNWTWIVGPK